MKAKKLPVGLRILFGFLSVILCVALFATTVLTIVLADVRVLTNEDNLQVIISHVLFGTPIQKPAPVAPQAVGGMKLDETDSSTTGSMTDMVVDALYDLLGEQFGEEVPFTKEEVGDLLDQSTIPDFLSDKMAGIMSDIYTGNTTTTITGEEVAQLLEENKALIEDTIGMEMPQEYVDTIINKVNEMDVPNMIQNVVLGKPPINPDSPESGEEGIPGDNIMSGSASAMETFSGGVINGLLSGKGTIKDIVNGGIPVILMAVREVTSLEAMLIVIAACVILIGLLFVVNLKQLHIAVRCVGITAMLAGLPFAAATVVAFAVPSLFVGTALSIVYLGLTLTAGVSFGVFGGGLVLVIVSIVMTAIFKKNLKTPVAVPVAAPVEVAPEMPVMAYTPVAEPAFVAAEVPAQPEAPVEEEIQAEEMPVMEAVEPVDLPVAEEIPVEEVAEEEPAEV
ncbi:MAG: hypothetical protein J6A88_04500 [Oscillospiraceae bacterium]|nr:hypothetical protein [Oscillospiraceae bacterium]